MPFINHVQIFENRGAMMGASNPHPHCQIWSNRSRAERGRQGAVRSRLARMARRLSAVRVREAGARPARARRRRERAFLTVVPFWAVWPFETMVIAKRHLTAMDALTDAERDALADILQRTTARYDRLFQVPFPYSMGFHQRPTDGAAHEECHFHAHFYPPLLRSATVRKFLVGYEMLAGRSATSRRRPRPRRRFAAGFTVYSVSTFSKKTPWNWPGFRPVGSFQLESMSTSGGDLRDVRVEARRSSGGWRAPRRTPSSTPPAGRRSSATPSSGRPARRICTYSSSRSGASQVLRRSSSVHGIGHALRRAAS